MWPTLKKKGNPGDQPQGDPDLGMKKYFKAASRTVTLKDMKENMLVMSA